MRKKYPLLFMLCTWLSCYAHAQTLMPYVGGTLTNTTASFESDRTHVRTTTPGIGFAAGILYEANMLEYLDFGTGLYLDQRKFQYEENARDVIYTSRGTTRYYTLNIPVTFKFKPLKSSSLGIKGGIALSYGLGGTVEKYIRASIGPGMVAEGTSKGKIGFERSANNGTDIYFSSRFDPAITIGIDYKILKRLILDVRYVYGLSEFEVVYSDKGSYRIVLFGVAVPLK